MTRRLLFGNEAFCEGAIAAGVRFYAGYPITPATEIAETMSRRMILALVVLGHEFIREFSCR